MGGIFGICLIPWLSELFWISIKLWLFWIPWIFRIFLIFWKRKKNNHMGILVMMMPAQRKWMSRTIETKSSNKDKDTNFKKKSQKLERKRTTVKTVPAEEKLMSRTIKRRVGELSLVHFRQTIPNRLITCVWLVPIFGVPWIVWRCNFLNIVESKCQCWILIRSPLFSALHWYFYSYFGVILWQFLGLTLMSPWLMW